MRKPAAAGSLPYFLLSKLCLSRTCAAFVVSQASTSLRSASAAGGSFSRSPFHTYTLAPKSWLTHDNICPSTSLLSSSFLAMTSSSSAQSTETITVEVMSDVKATAIPPVARRDEDRVVYAGIAPLGWKEDVPRQAETSTEKLLDPPVPVTDPYGWMRDEARQDTDVLQHLQAENAYTEQITAHLEPLRQTLYAEMLAAIQETDYRTPRPDGPFYYYSRTFQGKSYPVYCRAPRTTSTTEDIFPIQWDGQAESPVLPNEQVILDVNQLAIDQKYCSTGSVAHSPSHRLVAYSTDFVGGETYQLLIKDLESGQVIDHDQQLEIEGSICWGVDDSTLFYLKLDETHRPYQLYRRRLDKRTTTASGDAPEPDELLLEELDELFWMGIGKTLDDRYLMVPLSSKETSEIHYLDLHDANATLQCIAPRRSKVLYEVEHRDGEWWIASNQGGLPNMALWKSPAIPQSQDAWQLVVDEKTGRPLFDGGYDRSLDDVTCFSRHVVALGREGGLPRVWVMTLRQGEGHVAAVSDMEMLTFAEEAYDVGLGAHYEFETDKLVVGYNSLVTPTQSLEISMHDTAARTVLKQQNVPGYQKDMYGCDRLKVTARDGTEIPVSMVYRSDIMEEHMASGKPVHVHLYGYGSYGACMEADFVSTRLPLLNRGMVYVIAHVRGGGEMGRQWYEEPNGAKYLCKKNTFNDFVDVARWLVQDRKLTSPELLSCEGRSAGGLLIGASINQAPELFKTAILGVPFVDVVCTMIDATIPLTAVEWEEWGNPNEQRYFQYMLDYSPMQNVKPLRYPACLLTGGLHDPRVQYWEPAKFASELRYTQEKGSGPVCVKMDMSAGHFSASDRYKYLRELAFDFAFLLDQMGLAE